jgi:heme/copper-type cytochrome/quinol oxidase subunit 1
MQGNSLKVWLAILALVALVAVAVFALRSGKNMAEQPVGQTMEQQSSAKTPSNAAEGGAVVNVPETMRGVPTESEMQMEERRRQDEERMRQQQAEDQRRNSRFLT